MKVGVKLSSWVQRYERTPSLCKIIDWCYKKEPVKLLKTKWSLLRNAFVDFDDPFVTQVCVNTEMCRFSSSANVLNEA